MRLEQLWESWCANRTIKVHYGDEIKPKAASGMGRTALLLQSPLEMQSTTLERTGSWPLGSRVSWKGDQACSAAPRMAETPLWKDTPQTTDGPRLTPGTEFQHVG